MRLRDALSGAAREPLRQFAQKKRWKQINTAMRDSKDSEIGRVGYEINFNRYFYKYQPPRPLEEIEVDIKLLEKDILEMLREVAG